jgi:hypothetical protein
MRWLWMCVLGLSLGCGESGVEGSAGGAGSGGGFDGCGDVAGQCSPTMSCSTTTCSFDPAEVDCNTACARVIAVCDGACGEPFCDSVITTELCLTTCELEKTFSCGNATFGCYTLNDSCDSIAMCLGCSES